MGIEKLDNNTSSINTSHKKRENVTYNCRVALWQMPYNEKLLDYDTDKSKWYETTNKNHNNELDYAERMLKTSLRKFKVYSQISHYDDNSVVEISKYPNGNNVKVEKNNNCVYVKITDKTGNIAAEKIYNYSSLEGRKIVYKHCVKNNDTFTVVRIFSYNTAKNRSSDIVNYGYTSEEAGFTEGCTLEKEYYLLNGNNVKAETKDGTIYCVKDRQGNIMTFNPE